MFRGREEGEPWMKWGLGATSFFVIVALLLVGGAYYYLKSINIEDIAVRHSDETVADFGQKQTEAKKLQAIIETSHRGTRYRYADVNHS